MLFDFARNHQRTQKIIRNNMSSEKANVLLNNFVSPDWARVERKEVMRKQL